VVSKKKVEMVELKNLANMTDEEIDAYALEIWKKFAEKADKSK
jgi:hypothetical protein